MSWKYAGKVKRAPRIPPFETHLLEWGGGHRHGLRVTAAKDYIVLDVVCDGGCHEMPLKVSQDWWRALIARYDNDPRPWFLIEQGEVTCVSEKWIKIKKKITLRFALPTDHGLGLMEIEVSP